MVPEGQPAGVEEWLAESLDGRVLDAHRQSSLGSAVASLSENGAIHAARYWLGKVCKIAAQLDAHVFNVIVEACVKDGLWDPAQNCLRQMILQGFVPN